MREVVYGAASSFDGFITGPDEAIDWLHWSNDVLEYMQESWQTFDTLIMGRKTYQFMRAVGDSGAPMENIVASYVFSRSLRQVEGERTHLVRDDAAGFVRRLKEQPGKRICLFGGGDFAQTLLAADLVDEIGVNLHPVILGGGAPLLRDAGHRISLTLLESRPMSGGCVLLRYGVKLRT